ncbi:helix-turn-helix domain-containing protein [Nonomuraea rubra]
MSDGLYTIGEPARRTGLPVRTIRFWSDRGVLPPTGRSAGGYRLYDEAAVTRLGLVRMLRELGVGLEAVQEVLARRVTVAEVARLQLRTVDAELRALRARRAELPDSPSPEQVEAWVELAELISDEDFRRRLRRIALAGAGPLPAYELRSRVLAEAGPALASGMDPASEAGRRVLSLVAGPAVDRAALLEWMETVADERVERYWALLAALNGHQRSEPAVPAFTWVIAALRAHGTGS